MRYPGFSPIGSEPHASHGNADTVAPGRRMARVLRRPSEPSQTIRRKPGRVDADSRMPSVRDRRTIEV